MRLPLRKSIHTLPFPFAVWPGNAGLRKAEPWRPPTQRYSYTDPDDLSEEELASMSPEEREAREYYNDMNYGIDSNSYSNNPTRRTRLQIEDEPAVPHIAWNAAHRLREHYDQRPDLAPVRDAFKQMQDTQSFGDRRKILANWRKILEHDAVLAMHHRLANLDPDGYGDNRIDSYTGIGKKFTGSIAEPALRLFQELQGMARYAPTPGMQKRYPWTPEWTTPPGEGHEFGDDVQYHGSPKTWTGTHWDPSKIRAKDNPVEYGPLGLYTTPDEGHAQEYIDPDRIARASRMGGGEQEGGVSTHQMPFRKDRAERFWQMPIPGMAIDRGPLAPETRRRFARWFSDMAKAHDVGKLRLKCFNKNNADSIGRTKYTAHDFYDDLSKLKNAMHSVYGDAPSLVHNLHNHLHTMALTAAGYDGARQNHPTGGETHALLPVSWNKTRGVRSARVDLSPVSDPHDEDILYEGGQTNFPKPTRMRSSRLPKISDARLPRSTSISQARSLPAEDDVI